MAVLCLSFSLSSHAHPDASQVTDNVNLRTRLRREQELILRHTEGPVAVAEKPPCWRVRLLTFCFLRFL